MPTTSNNGVRLHWDEAGSGTPVLLVMGASYSSAMWYPAIPALSAKHRVIWFDNRGTGSSEATDVASIADMAADAVAVLQAAGVEQAHIYGVSLGGVIVQEIARAYPERVRSLVLGCTGILSSDKPRAPKWLDVRFWLPKSWVAALLGRSAYGPVCPPERKARDLEVLARESPQRKALVAQQNALRAYAIERDTVATFDWPALVLHGTKDPLVKHAWGAELAEVLPQARFVSYEGAGHNYLVDVGEQAQQDVLDFLAEVDAAATTPA